MIWDKLTDKEKIAYVHMANDKNRTAKEGERRDWTAQELAENNPPLRLQGK